MRRSALIETLAEAGFLFDVPPHYTPDSRIVPTVEEMAPWVETIERLYDDEAFYRAAAAALPRGGEGSAAGGHWGSLRDVSVESSVVESALSRKRLCRQLQPEARSAGLAPRCAASAGRRAGRAQRSGQRQPQADAARQSRRPLGRGGTVGRSHRRSPAATPGPRSSTSSTSRPACRWRPQPERRSAAPLLYLQALSIRVPSTCCTSATSVSTSVSAAPAVSTTSSLPMPWQRPCQVGAHFFQQRRQRHAGAVQPRRWFSRREKSSTLPTRRLSRSASALSVCRYSSFCFSSLTRPPVSMSR